MSILSFFKQTKMYERFQKWRELGTYQAVFTSIGPDLTKSHMIRSCIRPLAEHTSKANAVCTDKAIEKMLNVSPNGYMSGKDFLYKLRTMLELRNTAFVYIHRDDTGKPTAVYPVPYSTFEAMEYANKLFIKFRFHGNAAKELTLPWDDLAVVRKDYNKSDIAGDNNDAVIPLLNLINTSEEGVANAVRATANLRGILKSTKAMLSPSDIKKQKETFVSDYLNLENEGGIASLDSTQEFTPITMSPIVTTYEQMKEFRENLYRYYGINDAIIMSNYTEYQFEAFYESRIEPFLVALSLEFTRKFFTERQRAFGTGVVYESSHFRYASNQTKLAMVQLVDRGALTPNEWREMFNLSPIDGGDAPIRMLNTQEVEDEKNEANQTKEEQSNEE